MPKVGEKYNKLISPPYTNTPQFVQFKDIQYIVKKTWKIGTKKSSDRTRA